MKNISTAAVVAFFYILISFSIDLFSGDITFSSASISHLLIGVTARLNCAVIAK